MSNSAYLEALEAVDWDFRHARRRSPWAAWHWYPARMHEGIPSVLTGLLSEPGATVLDPMCGSGTVLVAASQLGRRCIGIDLNPVAVEITAAKLAFPTCSALESLEHLIRGELTNLFTSSHEVGTTVDVPNIAKQEDWYHPQTLVELARIWQIVNALDDARAVTVGRACFSAILLTVSSQDKHWGWVCDNVKPDELRYRDAVSAFLTKLAEYRASMVHSIDGNRTASCVLAGSEVVCGDAATVMQSLPSQSIELVVTSPPYFSAHDYLASQRLSLLWQSDGFIRENGDVMDPGYRQWRSSEVGARFKRSAVEARPAYLEEIQAVIEQCVRVVAPSGHVCLLLGESRSREPVVEAIVAQAIEAGLELRFRTERAIPTQRQLSPRIGAETLFVFRSPPVVEAS